MGSSLVSNVEAAAAGGGGGDGPSLDLSSLLQEGNSALRSNEHRCTPTAMLQTLTHTFKHESICRWSICRSSGITHRQFPDATISSQQELGLPGNFLSAGCWDTCDPSTTCLTD